MSSFQAVLYARRVFGEDLELSHNWNAADQESVDDLTDWRFFGKNCARCRFGRVWVSTNMVPPMKRYLWLFFG